MTVCSRNWQNKKLPKIHVAIPVMDERDFIPEVLEALQRQHYPYFTVTVCVNQPDHWWGDPDHLTTCLNNAGTLIYLRTVSGFTLEVIDRSSRGLGWQGKQHGVGWARRTVMEHIERRAEPSDIILSLDADTLFSEHYLESVAQTFMDYPEATALSVPYYHELPEDQCAARAILHYEIYMRYYFLNLWRIKSPYAFTALGSAMAIPLWAYRKVGGMTPKLSGEDFYFLQKLRKAGTLVSWTREKVFPAARFSSRVFFGTGPAMIRGAADDWESYPIYPFRLFDEIASGYDRFPEMFIHAVETPVTKFLSELLDDEDPFARLRNNSREVNQFIRACHEKFDGLRILQYLKQRQAATKETGTERTVDEENLVDWFETFYPGEIRDTGSGMRDSIQMSKKLRFSFSDSTIEDLDRIRNFLANEEERIRKENPLI